MTLTQYLASLANGVRISFGDFDDSHDTLNPLAVRVTIFEILIDL